MCRESAANLKGAAEQLEAACNARLVVQGLVDGSTAYCLPSPKIDFGEILRRIDQSKAFRG